MKCLVKWDKLLTNLNNDDLFEWRNMYNIIIEKDVMIEELESKIEDFKATLKDVSSNQGDNSNYTLITWNNALRTNLKQKDKELMLLEEENKNLMKAINMLKFNTKIKEFEKDMIKQYLDPQSTFKKSETLKRNILINASKIHKLMKMAGVSLHDLTCFFEVKNNDNLFKNRR